MKENEKIKIGKITDAHGIKGELFVFVFSQDISWLKKISEIDLSKSNKTETFKVMKAKPHKKGFICTLEGFLDRNKAEEYIGFEVSVDSSYFVSKNGEALFLREILNFEVLDKNLGFVGVIKHFSSNGIQDLLVVERKDKSLIEIPFVKEFVSKIDFAQQKMNMDLPVGLIEINEAGGSDE